MKVECRKVSVCGIDSLTCSGGSAVTAILTNGVGRDVFEPRNTQKTQKSGGFWNEVTDLVYS